MVLGSGLCPSMIQNSVSDSTTDCCPSNDSKHDFPSYSSTYDSCDCCGCGFMQESSQTTSELAVIGSTQTCVEATIKYTITHIVEIRTTIPPNSSHRSLSEISPPIHLLNQVFLN